MSCDFWALGVRTKTLRSDDSVEEGEADLGTMVVVICNAGGPTGSERVGPLSPLTSMGKDDLGFIGMVATISEGIGARGGSDEWDNKKAGSRTGDLSGRGVGDTCPCGFMRVLIWSSEGMGFPGLESLARNAFMADLENDLDCMSSGRRKSTCSTQGSTARKPISANVLSYNASNRARGELSPGEGRV